MLGYTGFAWRKLLLVAAVVIVLALVALGAFFGPDLYRRWRLGMLHRRAMASVEKEDVRGAAMALREAMRIDDRDVGTIRLWIRLIDPLDSRDELYWRCELADLDPGDRENLLQIARLSVPLGRLGVGQRAIEMLGDEMVDRADYQNALAAYAIRRGDMKAALRASERACEIEPESATLRLSLANLRASASDPSVRAGAWAIFEQLRVEPRTHLVALRRMRDLAARESDWDRALAFSEELSREKRASVKDALRRIELLMSAGRAGDAGRELDSIEVLAKTDPVSLGELAAWMIARGERERLGRLIGRILPDSRERPEMQQVLAGAMLNLERWDEIIATFSGSEWERDDHLRLAALARARRALEGSGFAWRVDWGAAVEGALKSGGKVQGLVALVERWQGWREELVDLLWRIESANVPEATWALWQLHRLKCEDKDTAQLRRICDFLLRTMKRDLEVQNNWAYYSLLLGIDVARASEMAAALWRESPDDPVVGSTYALALWIGGRAEDALRILQVLDARVLEQPQIAALHGAILARLGRDLTRARTSLEIARRGRLLPEEMKIVTDALARMQTEGS